MNDLQLLRDLVPRLVVLTKDVVEHLEILVRRVEQQDEDLRLIKQWLRDYYWPKKENE